MKLEKLKKVLNKILPVFVWCLTVLLSFNANSASCFLINEPEEPEQIEKLKKIK